MEQNENKTSRALTSKRRNAISCHDALPLRLLLGLQVSPTFPIADKPGQLIAFVDAAHTNNLCCCRSTTGYAFLPNFGVISYCSKIQSTTATSSTEVEFLAAVTPPSKISTFVLSFWKSDTYKTVSLLSIKTICLLSI